MLFEVVKLLCNLMSVQESLESENIQIITFVNLEIEVKAGREVNLCPKNAVHPPPLP